MLRERFGNYLDAGLRELGARATTMLRRYSEVTYQAELDRLMLEAPTPERLRRCASRATCSGAPRFAIQIITI